MAVPKLVHDAKGTWKGESRLHQSWLPDEAERVAASSSALRVEANDAYAMIAYDWTYEGKPQEGTMLLAMDEETGAVEIGWTDTWHQASGVMHLKGDVSATGAVRTHGSFKAGEETWGWTIWLSFSEAELALAMENVTPAGAAEWAVRATYRRE